MEQLKKEVTTNSRQPSVDRRRKQKLRNPALSETSDERNRLRGLFDDRLLATALDPADNLELRERALEEMEQRYGWQEAADRLLASGPVGAGLARERWADWLPGESGPELGAQSQSMSPSHLSSSPQLSDSALPATHDPFSARSIFGESSALSGIGALIAPPGEAFPARASFASQERPWTALQLKRRSGETQVSRDPDEIRQRLGAGQTLDEATRARMERGLGGDLKGVRIHTGSSADGIARDLGARAFTLGADIGFAGGEYRPGTSEGDRLLAHELAHVLQQRQGRLPASQVTDTTSTARDMAGLEQEADRMADRVVADGGSEARADAFGPASSGPTAATGGRAALRNGKPAATSPASSDAASIAGRDAAGQDAAGRDAAGPDTAGRDAAGQYAAGADEAQKLGLEADLEALDSKASAAIPAPHRLETVAPRHERASSSEGPTPTAGESSHVSASEGAGFSPEGMMAGGQLEAGQFEASLLEGGQLEGLLQGLMPGAAGPALSGLPAHGRGTGVQLKGNPKDGKEELSPEEADKKLREAKQKGKTRGSKVKAKKPVVNAKPVKKAQPKPGKPVAPKGKKVGPPPSFAQIPAGPGGRLPNFQELKGSTLSRWDDEVAWHDYFQKGSMSEQDVEIDRWGLVGHALKDGAMEGFMEGGKAILMDTAINMASSKIPYLQGFVEIARIAYDPKKWAKDQWGNTGGKIGQGVDELFNGKDVISRIEGLLHVLDGANNIISLLSTICWIVAAVGFLCSFLFPPVFPFVALAAQWGITLGSISTLVGVFLSLARLGMVAARSLQILLSDSNPEDLLAQADSLKEHTAKFTEGATAGLGQSVRGRIEGKLKHGHEAKSHEKTPEHGKSTTNEHPPTRMQRVMQVISLATFNFGESGKVGSGLETAIGTTGKNVKTSVGGTKAIAKGGVFGPTAQKVQDMEESGHQVFASDKQRERFDKKLKTRGDKQRAAGKTGADEISRPIAKTPEQIKLEAHLDHTKKELQEAIHSEQEARGRLKKARRDVEEANKSYRKAVQDNASSIQAKQQEVEGRRSLAKEAHEHVSALQKQVALEQKKRTLLGSLESKHPQRFASKVAESEQRLGDLKKELASAHKYHNDTKAYVAEGELELKQVMAPVTNAKQKVKGAVQEREDARTDVQNKTAERQKLSGEKQGAGQELHKEKEEAPPGGLSKHQYEGQQERVQEMKNLERGKVLTLDFLGEGASMFHGQNHGVGETGSLTALGMTVLKDIEAAEKEHEKKEHEHEVRELAEKKEELEKEQLEEARHLGVAPPVAEKAPEAVVEEKPVEVKGGGEQPGGEKKEEEGGEKFGKMLQERLKEAKETLPAPPPGGPKLVDSTSVAFSELDAEERRIKFQMEVMTDLKEHGAQQMTGLQVIKSVSEANQKAVDQHEHHLDDKMKKQQEMKKHSDETTAKAQQGKGKGAEGQGMVAGFIGPFLKLMGIVPGKLLGNAGEGSQSVHKLDTGIKDQGKTSEQTEAYARQTGAEALKRHEKTDKAKGDADKQKNVYKKLDGDVTAKELANMQGMQVVEQTMQSANRQLTTVTKEKKRLKNEHDGMAGKMGAWAENHHTGREKILGDMEHIVHLHEAKKGEGPGPAKE